MCRFFTCLVVLIVTFPATLKAEFPRLDERGLAACIDKQIAANWQNKKVVPAPRSDEAEFVRRIYLDLTGRVPDILEARDFLDNPSENKRSECIQKLLEGKHYPLHFTDVFRAWWFPSDPERFDRNSFAENLLFEALQKNTHYDKMVYSFLSSQAFNSEQPANTAATVSRLFLGVKIACAQCHNHPFAKWTRTQFWETAAFFNGRQQFFSRPRALGKAKQRPLGKAKQQTEATFVAEIEMPGSRKKVQARYLDGTEALFDGSETPQVAFATWMLKADNPYFAKAAVNRVWEYFLGTGLVDPIDDIRPENPASHPALLDELAHQFVLHDFDLKYLIRSITLSEAYQRTSKQTHPSQENARLFARMKVRGLSPEQLFDSLAVVTGQTEHNFDEFNRFARWRNVNSPRAEFLERFPNQDKRTEQTTSILQALYFMNGKIVSDATSLEQNSNLTVISESESVPIPRRIKQIFLITLARTPNSDESARLVRYVDQGGPDGNRAQALCDVFWALLNSSEFCINH